MPIGPIVKKINLFCRKSCCYFGEERGAYFFLVTRSKNYKIFVKQSFKLVPLADMYHKAQRLYTCPSAVSGEIANTRYLCFVLFQ